MPHNPAKLKQALDAKLANGNPDNVPLFESLDALASWVDYEADVVEEAAKEAGSKAGKDQAKAMHEAADELEEASDEAKETAAETFVDTGVPSDQQGDEIVAGNPKVTEATPTATSGVSDKAASSANAVISGNPGNRLGPILRGNPSTKHWYDEGFARGEGLGEDAPSPLSGEMGGESIPEIFGSADEATDENMDAYEAGYYAAIYGNPATTEQLPNAPAGRQNAAESTPQGTGASGEHSGQEGAIVEGNPEIDTSAVVEKAASETRDKPPGDQHWLFRPFKALHDE